MSATLAVLLLAGLLPPAQAPTTKANDPTPWIEVLADPATREEAEFRLLQLGPAVGVPLRDAILARVRAKQACGPQVRVMIVLGRHAVDAVPALAEVFTHGSRLDQAIAARAYLALLPHVDPALGRPTHIALIEAFTTWNDQVNERPAAERFRDAEYIAPMESAHDAGFDRSGRLLQEDLLRLLERNVHDVRIAVAIEILERSTFTDDERHTLLAAAIERALANPHDLVAEARCADGFEWRIAQDMLRKWPPGDAALDATAEVCCRAVAETHPNSWCREQAVVRLAAGKTPAVLATLARALRDPARRVVLAAIASLAQQKEWYRAGGAVQDLYLFSDDSQIREAARAMYLKLSCPR